jgi:mevalonate kinase
MQEEQNNYEEIIKKMELAREKLEMATMKNEASLAKMAEEKAAIAVSGLTEAGIEPPKLSEDEIIKREIQAWFPKDLLPDSLK